MILESYTSVHCTVSNPCAQRSRILLTPIRIIHFTVYYASIWTSGRQWVDCIKLENILTVCELHGHGLAALAHKIKLMKMYSMGFFCQIII